jgi:lipopolysaccharide biosynthesis glycosyltransferase
MKIVNIACASDDHYFPGMFAAIASLLVSSDPTYKYDFYIIDGGISDHNFEKLKSALQKIKVKSEINILKPDLNVFEKLPKYFFGSVLPYARLLLPDLVSVEKIIYIDSDILFLKDIALLWELNLEENYSAAALDMGIRNFKSEYPDCSFFNLDPASPFFNSGVMLMDLKAFREFGLHLETLRIRFEYPDHFKLHDQSPLNVVLNKKNLFLDQSWNFQSQCYNPILDFDKLLRFEINFHFVTSFKPWLYYNENPPSLLFYKLLNLLDVNLENEYYLKSKNIFKIKNKLRCLLPSFYLFRSKYKLFISKKKESLLDSKISEFWKEANKFSEFYKKETNNINNLIERWENRITKKKQ